MENVLKVQKEMFKKKIRQLYLLWGMMLFCSVVMVVIVAGDDEGVGLGIGLLGGGFLLLINLMALIQILRMHLKKDKLDPSFDKLDSAEKARLNEEILNSYCYKNVLVCRDAILIHTICLKAVPMKEVVWVYGKTIQQRRGALPSMRFSNIVVTDKNNKKYEIQANMQSLMGSQSGDFEGTEDLFETIHTYAPWAFFGYEENMVKNHGGFGQMVQTVEERQRGESMESWDLPSETEDDGEVEEKVLLGILGAILGGLLGSLIIMLGIEWENRTYSAAAFLALSILSGYLTLGKVISKKVFPISLICMIPTMYLGYRMGYASMIAEELDMGFVESFRAIPDYLEAGILSRKVYWDDLTICYIIGFVALIILFIAMRRRQR